MIKVYSIEEIVEASNNILNDKKNKSYELIDDKVSEENQKISKDTDSIINETKNYSNNEKKIANAQEPLILIQETIQTSKVSLPETPKKKKTKRIFSIKEKNTHDKNKDVVDKLYSLLSKKVRKSMASPGPALGEV